MTRPRFAVTYFSCLTLCPNPYLTPLSHVLPCALTLTRTPYFSCLTLCPNPYLTPLSHVLPCALTLTRTPDP
jgi:hypothetical protein